MIAVMLRALVAAAVLGAAVGAACSKPPVDPLELDRGILTVSNNTPDTWTNVEIWINQQFRVTVPAIEARSRFQVPLNAFVEGFGHRFDFSRMQIKDLRLSARTSGGAPVELKKDFQKSGLEGVQLGGKH
jgi:hypothetical protein